MINHQNHDDLLGLTATDADGGKIGDVGQVYLDESSGEPGWVTVSTGMFGLRESFAPLDGASVRDGQLVLAVSRQLVKDAPNIDSDGHLDDADVAALYQHYAAYLGSAEADSAEGTGADGYAGRHVDEELESTDSRAQDHGTSETTGDAITRSEERLRVGTENVETGRVRLRKYVVTENVSTTVPVSHEEVRLEREPITEANSDASLSGVDITEEEREITLHAERPVVAKETVPVERVRLSTETVTEEQQVNDQVRKEQIDEPVVDSAVMGTER